MELISVPSQNAFFAQCCRGKAACKSFAERGQGLPQIWLFHQTSRNVPAGNEVVDALQKFLDAGIEFVQIGDDGNAGGARTLRSGSRRGRIVAIYAKSAV